MARFFLFNIVKIISRLSMIGVEYVASEGRVIQKMGPLGRVYPYFRPYPGVDATTVCSAVHCSRIMWFHFTVVKRLKV